MSRQTDRFTARKGDRKPGFTPMRSERHKMKQLLAQATRSNQVVRMHEDGYGYDTLRPTKGWRSFSMRRLLAGMKVAAILDRVSA